jgi:hypothetical protein
LVAPRFRATQRLPRLVARAGIETKFGAADFKHALPDAPGAGAAPDSEARRTVCAKSGILSLRVAPAGCKLPWHNANLAARHPLPVAARFGPACRGIICGRASVARRYRDAAPHRG